MIRYNTDRKRTIVALYTVVDTPFLWYLPELGNSAGKEIDLIEFIERRYQLNSQISKIF